jgi:hypothetical protein
MKNTIYALILLLLTGFSLKAQQQATFKMKVAPNKSYDLQMKMSMNMLMDISGDTAMVNQMKKAGQPFPMNMVMDMGMGGLIKTNAANANNNVPFVMAMKPSALKMVMNGKETPIPMPAVNETVYGFYTSDGKMSIDSIAGKKADDATKEAMMKMADGIQATIKFPDGPMKIGDTFTQDLPMNLPMAGLGAGKMTSKTTYKLTAIENNKAYFDLVYDFAMDMSTGMSMNMTGNGDGKLVYDMLSNYPQSTHGNMSINYDMKMPQAQNMNMAGKMKMVMDVQNTITGK